MAGVSLADIADLLGHKDLATTQIYAKVHQEHLRGVVAKLTPLVPLLTVDAQTGRAPRMSPENVTQAPDGKEEDTKLLENKELTDEGFGNGGEAGIRTLDTAFGPYNGLANRRLQPLGHLTAGVRWKDELPPVVKNSAETADGQENGAGAWALGA